MKKPVTTPESWQQEKLFFDGDSFFKNLFRDLGKARKSIDFECYLYLKGVLSRRLEKILIQKARQGISVRLLLDGFGSWGYPEKNLDTLRAAGVTVGIYHPLPAIFSFMGRIRERLAKVNHRNHRKMLILDERTAYVGGMNIDDRHLREVYGTQAWRDSGVKVVGTGVQSLSRSFHHAFLSRKFSLKITAYHRDPPHRLIRLNDLWKRRREYRRDLSQRILNAKSLVQITTPYFNPPLIFLKALAKAARRGVAVHLLLPQKPDHFAVKFVSSFYYTWLLARGVRIFEYRRSVLHGKTQMMDDWATVGSSNKNVRSFFYDLEIDIVLTQKKSLTALKRQFALDLRHSQEIVFEKWKNRSLGIRILEHIFNLWNRWL